MKLPYSSLQNDFEQLTAHLPFAGTGIALRFSTRLIPSMMRTAYGPVHIKAEVIILPYNLTIHSQADPS